MPIRRLLLLRHAKAERPRLGQADQDRTLNERGRADAARLGAYIGRHGFTPDRALVSPATRTRETWSLVRESAGAPIEATEDGRLYEATDEDILEVVKEAPDEARTLLVVGHNPGLHDLAMLLVASGDLEARQRLNEQFPTAALAVIEFPFDGWTMLHPQSGRLERFISPKVLIATTD